MNLAGMRPPFWNVPYQRNPFFTGREEALQALRTSLCADTVVALSHPQGISGLGGIGKTQTALEYAYSYSAEYKAVFWVRASSTATLVAGFVDLAHLLEIPEQRERDQRLIVEVVLRWLRRHTGWLLILDNMDDLSVAEPFLPRAGTGHIVFTTRAHALGGIAQRLEVRQMEPETGALLLLRRASILPLQTSLGGALHEDREVACEISRALDGLPLALDQAGAYMKEVPCTLRDYLTLYQTRRQDLLQARGANDQEYPASVATTWSLSFEKVHQANPATAELLDFCAFLAPDAIPEEILAAGSAHLGAILAPVADDPMHLDLACKEALRFSLLHREADSRTLTMHRLVQAVLQDNLPPDACAAWKQRTVSAVNAAFPLVEFEHWVDCQRLLPHAMACAAWVEQDPTILDAARLLNQAGHYLGEQARYTEAEPLMKRALAIKKRQWGEEHPATATGMSNLAAIYEGQGKYEEAEPLYQRALAIYQQQLGEEHPDTASCMNNLAGLYESQGRYEEAEPLYRCALAICEQQLGSQHPHTAENLNNLAALYVSQGRYEEAEPLYQRALEIHEQVLGAAHPSTASSLNNLAALYYRQGKYEEAEALYQRALALRERQLGKEHADIASSLNNLAMLYESQGRYEEAIQRLQRALAVREQLFGAEHPAFAINLNNLAVLYERQGNYEAAESHYRRAISIDTQAYGAEHPEVAADLDNLAQLYFGQGKYEEAEPLMKQALAVYEQWRGPDHPDTAISLNNLAGLYESQGKYEEAESLYRRALAICEQRLGLQHPNTAASLNNLAQFYWEQEGYGEAEPLMKQVLAIYEQQLGADDPDTLEARSTYASLLQAMGGDGEAKAPRTNK